MFKTKKVTPSTKPSAAKPAAKAGADKRAPKKVEVKKSEPKKLVTPKISTLRSGEVKSGTVKNLTNTPASRSLLRMAAKVGIAPGANKNKPKVTELRKRSMTPSSKLKAAVVRVAPSAPPALLRDDEPVMKAAQAAVDKKGFDVIVLDVAEISGLCDRMIICSARSTTHLSAVADGIEEAMRKAGQRLLHSDGRRTAEPEWVLLDYGDVMVHVFRAQSRVDYQLEEYYSAGKVLARLGMD
jgi:ribosome-associated protein